MVGIGESGFFEPSNEQMFSQKNNYLYLPMNILQNILVVNAYFREMSGSNDPDDLIVAAFKAYEEEDRKVSAEKFR
jgi:hypothetical protein